ncbi:TPA: hypothetical protein ACGFA2_004476 [Serratia marcescens]|uniref:hypothetical protein n=1 Tax=Serratia marcescens TaxID=615 RepID=UPI0036FF7E50
MAAITTVGGITIVAPKNSSGLLADIQYLEPYASSAFNRKAYGIFGAGVYQGFSVAPGNGLNVIVKPNGTKPGVASVNVNGYQITVQLLTEQTVALSAGKLNIVVLEAKYGLGITTDQVNADSKIKAASLFVVNDEKNIIDGMTEICRVNLAANATSVPAGSISIANRYSLKVSYEPTDDINDARDSRLLTVKAGRSFIPIAGGNMTGPLGVTRLVFSDGGVFHANKDIDRENGFTLESLSTINTGYPVPGGLGTLVTFKSNEYRNVQLAFGSGNTEFYLRSMRKDTGASTEKWDRVYTQAFKPTAADVGALTDAQAAQKYALRSIKVNGKPLSSDVNLLAGDVNAYNKTESDGRYLSKASNLADITDKAKARGSLGLGDAATRNVGVAAGQLMAVGAFGLGAGSRHFENAYCNTAQFYRVNETSENAPGKGVFGVVSLPCDGGPSSAYLAIQNDGSSFFGRSTSPADGVKWSQAYTTNFKPTITDVGAADHRNNFAARMGVQRVLNGANTPTSAGVWSVENSSFTPVPWGSLYVTTNQSTLSTEPGNQRFIHYLFIGHGNGNKLYAATNNNGSFSGWSQYYSTAGKPTAADVGALTDAEAAQKYALRSIRVNGKPLTSDINLLASDVDAYNKSESDSRYFSRGLAGTATDVAWNSPSGFYSTQASGMTSVLHFHLGGTGSTRSAGFRFNYGNGGIAYRSSRDGFGYEKGWTKIYTELDKPKPSDIGTLSTEDLIDNFGSIAKLKVETNAAPSWVLLGTASNMLQYGATLTIDVMGGAGYNASERNNASQRIMLRTNNGSITKINDPFRAIVTSHHYGLPAISEVRAIEVSANKYELYVLVAAYVKNVVFSVTASVKMTSWVYSFATQNTAPAASIRFISNSIYHSGNNPAPEDIGVWGKEESDERYVKKSSDVMSGPLTLPRVIFPSEGLQASSADNDLTRPNGFVLEQIGDKSKGYPLTMGNLGNLMTFKINRYRNVQFVIGSGNTEFWLRSMRDDNTASLTWARVYTTDYKPSAADVGALTDAQAAKKYALRSIKVNGKPLSSDVNLLAGDVNAYNKTESDGRYVKQTGDRMSGQLIAQSLATSPEARPHGAGAFSAQLNTQAPFFQPNWQWPVTSGGDYVPIVKGVSTRQGQGYPSAVSFGYLLSNTPSFAQACIHVKGDNTDFNWRFDPNNGNFYCPGGVYAAGAILHVDGNITGSIWGGYLSDWLNNNINNRATWDYVNQNFVRDIRLASRGEIVTDGAMTEAPWGAVITGGNGNEGNQVGYMYFRYLQKNVNGNWYTVAYA